MMFIDTHFLVFILATVPAFHLLPVSWRRYVLAVSGVLFYAWNAGWWVLLFFSELFISRFYGKGARACWLGIFQALTVLAIFKYSGFFEESVRAVLGLEGGRLTPAMAILPLAISFFTFEFISFAADVHSGKVVQRSFMNYAAFIFFFPTLVAGPIKRYGDFIGKLDHATFNWQCVNRGITRILVGLFKKFVLADSLFQWTRMLDGGSLPNLTGIWVWQSVFAYGFRIYFDFSGYADIAIGTALLFGIVVPENFHNPYLTRNISEFWKSWHISLYRWLVDYIFVPLGGSRDGAWMTCRNILLVTGLSGLWHGASWNFVMWGCYHGILLCLFHAFRPKNDQPAPRSGPLEWLKRAGATALTFVLVMFGWTFFAFKSEAIPAALAKMFFLQ